MADGAEVMQIMRSGAAGPDDVWRRPPPRLAPEALPLAEGFTFSVPSPEQLDWSGPGGNDGVNCTGNTCETMELGPGQDWRLVRIGNDGVG